MSAEFFSHFRAILEQIDHDPEHNFTSKIAKYIEPFYGSTTEYEFAMVDSEKEIPNNYFKFLTENDDEYFAKIESIRMKYPSHTARLMCYVEIYRKDKNGDIEDLSKKGIFNSLLKPWLLNGLAVSPRLQFKMAVTDIVKNSLRHAGFSPNIYNNILLGYEADSEIKLVSDDDVTDKIYEIIEDCVLSKIRRQQR